MSKLLASIWAIVLVCTLSLQQTKADVVQRSFLIKGRPMDSAVGALAQLRHFLSNHQSVEKRCQRQAILLSALERGELDQYDVAKIALARKDDTEKKYNQINVEHLRDLYINATRQYLEAEIVDASMMELLNCLKAGFRSRDARARSFLNNDELQTIEDQYNAFTKQPVRLLLNGDASNTGLNLYEFNEGIKSTVRRWIGDDGAKFQRLFSADNDNQAQHHEHGDRSGNKKPQHQRESNQQADAHAYAYDLAQAHAQTQTQIQTQTQPQAQAQTQATENQMDSDDQDYTETIFESVISVYNSLLEVGPYDRCRAYEQVIEATREQLDTLGFLNQVVEEALNRITQEGPMTKPFVPEKSVREDFLFVIRYLDPQLADIEVWIDLDGCVTQWADEDQDVMEYTSSLYRQSTLDEISELFESDDESA